MQVFSMTALPTKAFNLRYKSVARRLTPLGLEPLVHGVSS